MVKNWLPFTIDLESLYDFVAQTTTKHDGIISSPSGYEIVEKIPFTPSEVNAINAYINSLTQSGEAAKIDKRETIRTKIISFTEAASSKPFTSLHSIEKKLINKTTLTDAEREIIFNSSSLNGASEIPPVQVELDSIPVDPLPEMQSTNLQDAINELTNSITRSGQPVVFQLIGQMNSNQYLVSNQHSVSGLLSSSRRSGNASNGYRYENSAPQIALHTGTVISAAASIRGVAKSGNDNSPSYQLKFELWNVGFTSEGTKLGDIIFNVPNSYTIGNWWDSSVVTGFAANQPQNVNVTAGARLALKFIRQEGAGKVVAVENTTIVLEIKKASL